MSRLPILLLTGWILTACTTAPSTPDYDAVQTWGVHALTVDGRGYDVSPIQTRRFDLQIDAGVMEANFKVCNTLRFTWALIETGEDASGLRTTEAVSTAAACLAHGELEDALRDALRTARVLRYGAETVTLESSSSRLTLVTNP